MAKNGNDYSFGNNDSMFIKKIKVFLWECKRIGYLEIRENKGFSA